MHIRTFKGKDQTSQVLYASNDGVHEQLWDYLGRHESKSFLSVLGHQHSQSEPYKVFRYIIEIDGESIKRHNDFFGTPALKPKISNARAVFNAMWRQVIRLSNDLGLESDDIWVWYSGNKSYFIEIPNVFGIQGHAACSNVIRASLEPYIEDPEITEISINTPNGMIRAPYSIHEETKRMVVPLSWEIINSQDFDLIPTTMSDDEMILPPYHEWGDEEYMKKRYKLKNKTRYMPSIFLNDKHGIGNIGVVSGITVKPNCLTKLLAKGATKGKRWKDSTLIASYCAWQGLPLNACLQMIVDFITPTLADGEDIQKYVKSA
jgi:hypothetical protein